MQTFAYGVISCRQMAEVATSGQTLRKHTSSSNSLKGLTAWNPHVACDTNRSAYESFNDAITIYVADGGNRGKWD